jgi:hypothetical protein
LDAEKNSVIVHIPGGFRHDFMKGFSQLVSDFIEAGRKFLWDFLHKKTAKNQKVVL